MSDQREKELLEEVIIGYRKVIKKRYSYENIQKRKGVPASFDEERVEVLRNYFLNYLYPPPEKRAELDAAFQSLDDYIKNPEKFFRLLVDSTSLIFKYGRHLPQILKAGITALQSFRRVNKLEDGFVKSAIALNLEPPYEEQEIEILVRSLSRKELDQFVEGNQNLFGLLHDRVLIDKIQEVIEHLIKKMRKRPKIYSQAQIQGFEIGQEIILKGNALFDQLAKEEQEKIFALIIEMEQEILDEIFLKKEK